MLLWAWDKPDKFLPKEIQLLFLTSPHSSPNPLTLRQNAKSLKGEGNFTAAELTRNSSAYLATRVKSAQPPPHSPPLSSLKWAVKKSG
ncbi:hypothetical protein ElyMa_005280300 [Elysia marginata]|uniref:Uncharacterized protein n=1 Tax=Elysia marginata TaxID=1093978 RepID=A0AAV4K0P3_9GAST|nr:hypothetical protein ElyMa_005280300 [Elysia marginata]